MQFFKLVLTSFFTALFILISFSLFAQTPEGVSYQAVLRNSAGLPMNTQSVSVRFTIHQNSVNGLSVFSEIHPSTTTVTNQFGLVNLKIGSVNTTDFPLINWALGTYFLQVEVDPGTGFEDLGATQLLSVPYALYAKTAGNGPQGLSSLIDTTSVAPLCPNGGYRVLAGLDLNGNSNLDAGEITSSFIVCNGMDGLSINWLGSTAPTTPSANDAYYNSADGVSYLYNATSSNWDTLSVNGANGTNGADGLSINWLGQYSTQPGTGSSNDAYYNSAEGISYIYNGTTTTWDTLVAGGSGSDNDWVVNGANMYLDPSVTGNVGVGTVNPNRKLTVFSNDTIVANFVGTNSEASAISIIGTNPSAKAGALFVVGSDTGIIAIDPSSNQFFVTNNTVGGNTLIFADSTTSLQGKIVASVAQDLIYNKSTRIYNETDSIFSFSNSGTIINVNQGRFYTDSLYVYGNNKDSLNWVLANDGFGQAIWKNPATFAGGGSSLWQSSAPDVYFNTGNVGIGTNTPSSPLTINTVGGAEIEFVGSSNASIETISQLDINSGGATMFNAGSIYLRTNFLDRLTILNNGYVGIGVSNPVVELDVNGETQTNDLRVLNNIYYNNNPDTNFVLMDDGTGTGHAVWQHPDSLGLVGGAFTSNGGSTVLNNVSDKVGIGTNSPQQLLTLSTLASTTLRLERASASAFDWEMNVDNLGFHLKGGADGTSGSLTDFVNVDGNGKMGLGITTPTQLLHLYGGTLRIDNGVKPYNLPAADGNTGGQVLTTDGLGNTAWQTPSAGSSMIDADGDTEINVEASPDQDVIHFSLGNSTGYTAAEYFTMIGPRLEVINSGNSVFIGAGAGANDDLSANQNTYIGYTSGLNSTTGNSNVGVGYQTLTSLVSGARNTASGYQALELTTGNDNTGIGYNALSLNLAGSKNTALGRSAGAQNTSGNNNVNIGMSAGASNTTGSDNLNLGYRSGFVNTGGSNNVTVGTEAGYNSTGSGNVFLGYQAGYSEVGNNHLYIANSNTTTPLIWGDFTANQLKFNAAVSIVDGTQGANKVLTSDAAGNASWQTLTGGTSLYTGSGSLASATTVNQGTNSLTFNSTQNYGFNITNHTANNHVLTVENITDGTPNYAGGSVGARIAVSAQNMDKTAVHGAVTGTGTGNQIGVWGAAEGVGSGFNRGINANARNSTNTNIAGDFIALGNTGTNYGLRVNIGGTQTATKYGLRIITTGSALGTKYGVYTQNEDHNYFSGNVGVGITSPLAKLHVTGGAILANWTNTSGTDANLTVLNTSGTSPGYTTGTLGSVSIVASPSAEDKIAIQGLAGGDAGNKYAIRGVSSGLGSNYGVYAGASGGTLNYAIEAVGTASGSSQAMGVYSTVNGTTTGNTYGVYGQNASSTTGIAYAGYFQNMNSTGSLIHGIRSDVNSSSGSNQYGVSTYMNTASAGTKYGIYSSVLGGTANWAAYFAAGDVYVQDKLVLPTGAGSGKVLTSDAAGNASWRTKEISFFAGGDTGGSQQSITQGTPTTLLFDASGTFLLNQGGGFNATNGRFTAPVKGVYHLDLNAVFAGGISGYFTVRLMHSSGDLITEETGFFDGVAQNWYSANLAATISLNSGDAVWIEVSNANSSMSLYLDRSSFSGHLVYAY